MVATIITAIGTYGLYRQITLTREAIESSSEATKAMQDANAQAKEEFRHNQKPHIYLEPFGYIADVTSFFALTESDPPLPFLYKVGIRIYNKGQFAFLEDFSIAGFGDNGRTEEGELKRFIEAGGTTYLGSKDFVESYLAYPTMLDRPGVPDERIQIPYATGFATSDFVTDLRPPPFYGWITYSDSLGIIRKRGFGMRPSGLRSGKFEAWGGAEYNYERPIHD